MAMAAQGKFWEMHDILYEHQAELDEADLSAYALKIGLEIYHFNADGKIVGGRAYFDQLGLMTQLGHAEAPAELAG